MTRTPAITSGKEMTRKMESRRRKQYFDDLDREIAEEKAKKAEAVDPLTNTAKERLPAEPEMHRHVHRLSPEEQDEWSDRMKSRYGGEW